MSLPFFGKGFGGSGSRFALDPPPKRSEKISRKLDELPPDPPDSKLNPEKSNPPAPAPPLDAPVLNGESGSRLSL